MMRGPDPKSVDAEDPVRNPAALATTKKHT
jgi:hypothetical protein